jgi:hypothetical protein
MMAPNARAVEGHSRIPRQRPDAKGSTMDSFTLMIVFRLWLL